MKRGVWSLVNYQTCYPGIGLEGEKPGWIKGKGERVREREVQQIESQAAMLISCSGGR